MSRSQQLVTGIYDDQDQLIAFCQRNSGTPVEVGFSGVLKMSAVPMIIPPNGTVTAAGKLVLGVALNTVYSGGAWVHLPAGAVVGGLAGFYWVQFGDTGTGATNQVYENYVNPAGEFDGAAPELLGAAAVGSGSAYVTSTALVPVMYVKLPGGLLGKSGVLRITQHFSPTTDAGTKGGDVSIGGAYLHQWGPTGSLGFMSFVSQSQNRGRQDKQFNTRYNVSVGNQTGTVNIAMWSSIDTSGDTLLSVRGQVNAPATGGLVVEALTIEVFPS